MRIGVTLRAASGRGSSGIVVVPDPTRNSAFPVALTPFLRRPSSPVLEAPRDPIPLETERFLEGGVCP